MDERLCLSTAEACKKMGVGRSTMYKLLRGTLPHIRVGRKILIPVKELEEWIRFNAAASAMCSVQADRSDKEANDL